MKRAQPLSLVTLDLLGADSNRMAALHVTEQRQMRWYNPQLRRFEWRVVPKSDEEALWLLAASPYAAPCTDTYRQWRQLGASIMVALMRAGEAARNGEKGEPSA